MPDHPRPPHGSQSPRRPISPKTRGNISQPVGQSAPRRPSPPTAQVTLPVSLAGDSAAVAMGFQRYRMGAELGRGGMGVVMAAEDPTLRRELAIKRLISPDPEARLGFLEEAQITGQLEHPNIVPVHELGVDPQGRPYLAMKRVRGKTLHEAIAAAHRNASFGKSAWPSELRRLLEMFLKVCDAVGYAHARGVIHRDLKPANIMVGEFGEVLVMDWGLAKPLAGPGRHRHITSDRRADGGQVTMQGDVVGTPAYMPPEQARGDVDKLDARADIYALGAILYTLLTNDLPVPGDDVDAILDRVMAGHIAPPSQGKPAGFVPRELDAVVMKAMAMAPTARYKTVGELRADIENYLDGRTLAAADYTFWQLLAKWASRNKAAVIGGTTTAAALLIGLVAVVWLVARGEMAEFEARENARQHALDERRISAENLFAIAEPKFAAAARVPFNPAAPQEYYRAWLGAITTLGQAIQTHPDAPQAWKDRLAHAAHGVLIEAANVGDWGVASHMAESARAWNAIDDATLAMCEADVVAARDARKQADIARLEFVLDRIADAENQPESQGGVPNPRALRHGEIEEQARRIARATRRSPGTTAALAIGLLRGDADTRASAGFDSEPLTPTQRLLVIELLGRLGDPHTTAGSAPVTAPELIADTLAAHATAESVDELGAWMRTAATLEAARPGCVAGALGHPLAVEFARIRGAYGNSVPIEQAISTGQTLLDFARASDAENAGTLVAARLPAVNPAGVDSPRYRREIVTVGDWVATAARSGSDFTAVLLDAVESASVDGEPLSGRQRVFLIEQLSLFGDTRAPDPARDSRTAPAMLAGMVLGANATAIDDGATGEDAWTRSATIAAVNGVSRFEIADDPALARKIFDLRDSGDSATVFGERTGLAVSLLPVPTWPAGAELTADDHLLRARVLHEHGEWNAALLAFNEATTRDSRNARIYFHRGWTRQCVGDLRGAMQNYDAAVALDPGFVPVYLRRSIVWTVLGRHADAIAECTRAIQLDVTFAGAFRTRGLAKVLGGDTAGAIADFDAALKLNPHAASAYEHRAGAFLNVGHQLKSQGRAVLATDFFGRAIADFDRAIALNPFAVVTLLNRGSCHRIMGNWRAAVADHTRAIEQSPISWWAYYQRGLALIDGREWDDALRDLDRAVDLNSQSWEAWGHRGVVLAALQRRPEAHACFDKCQELCPATMQAVVQKWRQDVLGR